MLTSTQKSDVAVGSLCLAVIAVLGLAVATDAIRNADFSTASNVEDVQTPEEPRQAHGTRPSTIADDGRPRVIAEPVPRRGMRPPPAVALFAEQRPITDAGPTRSRR